MPTFYENKNTPITTTLGKHLMPEAHLHNHLEMVYLTKGQTYAFCDDQTLEMEPGDVFIAFPNQVHGYPRKGDGTAEHNIIIFSPRVCSEFKDLFHRMVPVCPLVKASNLDPEIPDLIQRIFQANQNESPYKEAVTRGYLIAFLGKLLRSMELREERQSDGTLLKDILNYCNRHYTEPLSLDRLSKELNAGKHHISHIFSEKLKISFPDYINGLRINDATRKLAQSPDQLITDIAYDCGFSSTRTFNRAFVKHTGTTPRDYREKNLYKTTEPISFYIKD